MSELVGQLTMLEKRLRQERIDLLIVIAQRPQESSIAVDLSRLAAVHSALEAVRAEIADRQPREGYS
jgi:hypothetical protein